MCSPGQDHQDHHSDTDEPKEDVWQHRDNPTVMTSLLTQHMPLVDRLAARLKRRLPAHIRLDDLLAAGREGLWKAIQSFDPAVGRPFEHFAQARIRGAMLDELRRMDHHTRAQRMQMKQAAHQAYGAQAKLNQVVSLDADRSFEWLVDDTALSPEDYAIRGSDVKELNRAIIRLGQQEQLVLSLVFVEGLSLNETAEVMALSRSRVQQVYSGAIKSLRGSMIRTHSGRNRS